MFCPRLRCPFIHQVFPTIDCPLADWDPSPYGYRLSARPRLSFNSSTVQYYQVSFESCSRSIFVSCPMPCSKWIAMSCNPGFLLTKPQGPTRKTNQMAPNESAAKPGYSDSVCPEWNCLYERAVTRSGWKSYLQRCWFLAIDESEESGLYQTAIHVLHWINRNRKTSDSNWAGL